MTEHYLPPRTRRTINWWEVIFDPAAQPQREHGWDFTHEKGPDCATFKYNENLGSVVVADVTFQRCDFLGLFPANRIVFKNCSFTLCDFGLSTFERVKFSKCKFSQTSFTQCYLLNCQFQNCSFDIIGISDTDMEATFISNPLEFMQATATNLEHIPGGVTRNYQKWRFEETRSAIARQLLSNLSKEGPESSFYEMVQAAAIQECRARQGRARLSCLLQDKRAGIARRTAARVKSAASYAFAISDEYIMRAVGFANGWGKSTSRIGALGLAVWVLFSLLYYFSSDLPISASLVKSAELQFLFGYTKHTSQVGDGTPHEAVVFLNSILGLVWYLVFVPTLINRMTRVRA